MGSVTVNPPKTPVTKGSNGIAIATIPNVCKMPGPPAPFVPTPLPNIGKSGTSPQGYSTTVKIEGNAVAITGASFGSMGDVASKGLGGGIVSMNCEGPTKFVGPGSFDVQIEGKNVQFLGDPMLNNCGPAGSPPNAATMTGVVQPPGPMTFIYGDDAKCSICGETHPIPEGEEVGAFVTNVFKKLREKYQAQKPAIDELDKLAGELADLDRSESRRIAEIFQRREQLLAQVSGDAVLRYNSWGTGRGTFNTGYMVGAFVCACRKDKKCLITTSGMSPRGFVGATKGTGFTFVGNTFNATPAQLARVAELKGPSWKVWRCAAPKLIDAAEGHKGEEMTEMMFAPRGEGPTITFRVGILDSAGGVIKTEPRTKTFSSGDKCPSCEACQELLPAMLCKAKCN